MSDDDKKPWEIVYLWWQRHIQPREVLSRPRALSAILRRGNRLRSLCQPEVQELVRALGGSDQWRSDRLLDLVSVLANVRMHEKARLAELLGGDSPVLSSLRFERLMTAEGEELPKLMRRAVLMAGERCNVTLLARDMLFWNDAVRTNWCFDYFGAGDARTAKTAA